MSRTARRRNAAYTDSLSTSFLDVLSNGLGAGILLMVLIAAIPIVRPAVPVPDSPYIRASWKVIADPGAILALRLIPPAGGRSFDLDLRNIDQGALTLRCRWPGVRAAGRIEIFGFSVAGSATATVEAAAASQDRTFILWINEPVAGEWSISVIYANRSDSVRNYAGPITVNSSLETPDDLGVPRTSIYQVDFGGSASIGPFTIRDYGPDDAVDAREECKWL